MTSTNATRPGAGARSPAAAEAGTLCPFDLHVSAIARFLNCELADDPVYDGLELQAFDDPVHGTGMLAFLSRRADRRVDYYHEPGLRLDRDSYAIGGGTGTWTETDFEVARLEVAEDGVDAEVRFRDVDGRRIEVVVNDRTGRPRRRGGLLAPVGDGIEKPNALLLVLLRGFDLVHVSGNPPVIRIGGHEASTGRLPGARLHRRHLVKYAAPLCAVELNRSRDGRLPRVDRDAPGAVELTDDGLGIRAVAAAQGRHHARFALEPAFPDLATLAEGAERHGTWTVVVDDARVTGGSWSAARRGHEVELALDVTERWKPGPLPLLLRLVTTAVPVFRRWPTTYRWRARVALGAQPAIVSRWERTSSSRGDAYVRATQR